MLTQELFRNYHCQNGKSWCAFKVDIKKYYHSVNWDSFFLALQFYGFSDKMIKWIRECVSTPSNSVIVNEESHGFFQAKKGLRHGDPLSPYPFTFGDASSFCYTKEKDSGRGEF